MIASNYYQGFKKMCERNPKITRIPTKEELESEGCEITALCYLVIAGGMQYNPSVVNPEIIENSKVAILFVDRTPDIKLPEEEAPALKEPKDEDVLRRCERCNAWKPITAFRKKANKIPTWFNTCIQCQSETRHSVAKEVMQPTEEPKPTEPAKTPLDEVMKQTGEAIVDQCKNAGIKSVEIDENDQYVRVSKVKDYIKRAYALGVKETLEKLNIVEPTFEELMEGIE